MNYSLFLQNYSLWVRIKGESGLAQGPDWGWCGSRKRGFPGGWFYGVDCGDFRAGFLLIRTGKCTENFS